MHTHICTYIYIYIYVFYIIHIPSFSGKGWGAEGGRGASRALGVEGLCSRQGGLRAAGTSRTGAVEPAAGFPALFLTLSWQNHCADKSLLAVYCSHCAGTKRPAAPRKTTRKHEIIGHEEIGALFYLF